MIQLIIGAVSLIGLGIVIGLFLSDWWEPIVLRWLEKHWGEHPIEDALQNRVDELEKLLVTADKEINDDPTKRGKEIHRQIKKALEK